MRRLCSAALSLTDDRMTQCSRYQQSVVGYFYLSFNFTDLAFYSRMLNAYRRNVIVYR